MKKNIISSPTFSLTPTHHPELLPYTHLHPSTFPCCNIVTSVTSVTKCLEAPPEAALQILQWRKKTAANCNNCNILSSAHTRIVDDQPSAKGIYNFIICVTFLSLQHCNIATITPSSRSRSQFTNVAPMLHGHTLQQYLQLQCNFVSPIYRIEEYTKSAFLGHFVL